MHRNLRILSSLIMSESMHTISVTLHTVEQTDRVVCVSSPAAQQATSLIVYIRLVMFVILMTAGSSLLSGILLVDQSQSST